MPVLISCPPQPQTQRAQARSRNATTARPCASEPGRSISISARRRRDGGEHRDAVGEHDRLLHVVVTSTTVRGSRARARPSQACISARVIASSLRRLVQAETGLPESSVRRNATRWRMPRELVRVAASNPPNQARRTLCAVRGSARGEPACVGRARRCRVRSHGSSSRAGASAPPGALESAASGFAAADQLQQVVLPQPLGDHREQFAVVACSEMPASLHRAHADLDRRADVAEADTVVRARHPPCVAGVRCSGAGTRM